MNSDGSVTAMVIDDEPMARQRLRRLLFETPWLTWIGEAADGRSAIAAIDELQPDLVFLDVKLPGLSGVQALATTQHAPAVIFTTAHDEFALTAFELGALDYLLKPFGRERFARAVARVRPFLEAQVGATTAGRAREVLSAGPVPRLFVRDGDRLLPYPVGDVDRFEACDDYVIVHAGGRHLRLNLSLSALEARLDPTVFIRIHRSHVLNMNRIVSLTPYDGSRYLITLRDGATLIASRQGSRLLRDLSR